jgi:hypothetical protein
VWILWFLLRPTTTVPLPAQTLTTLYSFGGADGGNPGGLVRATHGNFYGTTAVGGASDNCYGGDGLEALQMICIGPATCSKVA